MAVYCEHEMPYKPNDLLVQCEGCKVEVLDAEITAKKKIKLA